ncbi:hypothetical protein ACP70R_032660 [Stipagrostis hirtigluma subsp. patula]
MAWLVSARICPIQSVYIPQASLVRSPPNLHLARAFENPLLCKGKPANPPSFVAAALEPGGVQEHTLPEFRELSAFQKAIAAWCNADAVCFDVDNTVYSDEGIDELADFCGAGQAVAEWTAKAMAGSVVFEEALATCLSLFKPSLDQVEDCLEKRPLSPVALELGIPPGNIFANRLLFGTSGEYVGFDPTQPTSRSGGKANGSYKTLVMIGDGATDLEARQPGGADLFICYGGVHMREAVAGKADWVISDFRQLMAYLA